MISDERKYMKHVIECVRFTEIDTIFDFVTLSAPHQWPADYVLNLILE